MKTFFVSLFVFLFAVLTPSLAQGQVTYVPVASQIAIGGGYTTDVFITNTSAKPIDITLNLADQNARPLPVDFSVRGLSSQGVGINPGTIMPQSSSHIILTSASPTVLVGSCYMAGDWASAQISVQYSYAPNGMVIGQASVVPQLPYLGFGFHAVNSTVGSNQNRTGVAIANPNFAAAHLTFTLIDSTGNVVDTVQSNLAGGGQMAKFVSEIFAPLPVGWSEGTVSVNSDQMIVGMTLNTTINGDGTFTFSSGSIFH